MRDARLAEAKRLLLRRAQLCALHADETETLKDAYLEERAECMNAAAALDALDREIAQLRKALALVQGPEP